MFAAFLLAAVSALPAAAQFSADSPLPAPTGAVNDYANIIDTATKQRLEDRLRKLKEGTDAKIEIAVVTIDSTEGRDIFDYSLAVARGWKIGSQEDDNPSMLLLVAVKDRKYFTQISRDAEGDINDGLAGQIQRQYLVPAFRAGQYGKGINDTVEAYIARFAQSRGFDPVNLEKREPSAPVSGQTDEAGVAVLCGIFACILIVVIFLIAISSLFRKAQRATQPSSWNGGSFGNRKTSKRDDDGGGFIFFPPIIGGGSGGSSDWGSSGGGDSWGGFGGGGDFGGGGAGGDW